MPSQTQSPKLSARYSTLRINIFSERILPADCLQYRSALTARIETVWGEYIIRPHVNDGVRCFQQVSMAMSTRQSKNRRPESLPHSGPQFRLLCCGLCPCVVDDLSDVMDRLLNKNIPPLRLHPQHAQSRSRKASARERRVYQEFQFQPHPREVGEFSPNIRCIIHRYNPQNFRFCLWDFFKELFLMKNIIFYSF